MISLASTESQAVPIQTKMTYHLFRENELSSKFKCTRVCLNVYPYSSDRILVFYFEYILAVPKTNNTKTNKK